MRQACIFGLLHLFCLRHFNSKEREWKRAQDKNSNPVWLPSWPCSYVEGGKDGQWDRFSFHQRSSLLNQTRSSTTQWERHGFPVREPGTEKQGPCRPGHIRYTKEDCIDYPIQHQVDVIQPKGGRLQVWLCAKHVELLGPGATVCELWRIQVYCLRIQWAQTHLPPYTWPRLYSS